MGTILLFLFIFFVVIPLFKVFSAVYKAKKQMRNAFRQAQGGQRRQERKAGWSKNTEEKEKIFDRRVGEYVDFEEIEHSEQPGGETAGNKQDNCRQCGKVERQIVDAEWEDIK